MPFVRISLPSSVPPAAYGPVGDAVHRALVDAIGIPEGDRFQLVETHPAEQRFFDPAYMGVERRDVVLVEIVLVRGRSDDRKRALFRRIAETLSEHGVRPEDVMVVLTENTAADWSVGNGAAQLLDLQPASA